MKIKKLLFLFVIYFTTTNAIAAACYYPPSSTPIRQNITLPQSVSIPRDAPDGEVIYESAKVTIPSGHSFTCSVTYIQGIKNYLGKDVPGRTQPIGDTGIGWQWIYQGAPWGGVASNSPYQPGTYSLNNTTHALRFVKIGAIKNNAQIPAGAIGALQTATIFPMTITTNGMSIVVPSCETPNVSVDMGSYDLSQIFYNTPYTASKRFNIKLNNCPVGITKVTYKLLATSTGPAIDPTLGIISLNSTSTAKGVALQIMDSSEQPLNLNLTHAFNDYSNGGGNFEIPMFARYVKKAGGAGEIKAGTANSEITFIMSYL
ncbi:fimbrial protein [Pseudomonas sp. RA_105y_Pfl2_P56]|uniref:fimbrial protein n=1 Tax=Pseudomonas sp. RA_105y_Pfl2_P56 TaxID=3088701 RepID=UPI0030D837A0